VLFALLSLLANGYRFHAGDQVSYIPLIQQVLEPDLYRLDPLIMELTRRHHTLLWPMLAGIVRLAGMAPTFFGVHLLVLICTFLALDALVAALGGGGGARLLAALLLVLAKPAGAGIATLDNLLLPRGIALPLELAALAVLLRGRPGRSGLLAGLAFNVHPTTATHTVLALLVVALVRAGRRRGGRGGGVLPAARLLGGFLVAASPLLVPWLVGSAAEESLFRADPVWLKVVRLRLSHHLFPRYWNLYEWFCAVFPLLLLLVGAQGVRERRVRVALLGLGAGVVLQCLVGGVVLAELAPVPLSIKLHFWESLRLAMVVGLGAMACVLERLLGRDRPWAAALAAVALTCGALVLAVFGLIGLLVEGVLRGGRERRRRWPMALIYLLPLGCAVGFLAAGVRAAALRQTPGLLPRAVPWLSFDWTGLVVLGGAAGLALLSRTAGGARRWHAFIGLLVMLLGVHEVVLWGTRGVRYRQRERLVGIRLGERDDAVAALGGLAREKLPRDALVLIPPHLARRFRGVARRAVVGGYKDGGMSVWSVSYARAWRRWMQTISGVDLTALAPPKGTGSMIIWQSVEGLLAQRFLAAGAEDLRRMGAALGAGYLLYPRGERELPFVLVGEADGLALYRLPGGRDAAARLVRDDSPERPARPAPTGESVAARVSPCARAAPSAAGAPGIVLISLDTLAAAHLPLYGCEQETAPVLRECSRREALLFANASSQIPHTLPSHMTMFTSLYPRQHQVYPPRTKLSAALPTITEQLAEAGFRTAGFTAGGFLAGRYGFSRGFER
jgi:hypothetical protein